MCERSVLVNLMEKCSHPMFKDSKNVEIACMHLCPCMFVFICMSACASIHICVCAVSAYTILYTEYEGRQQGYLE